MLELAAKWMDAVRKKFLGTPTRPFPNFFPSLLQTARPLDIIQTTNQSPPAPHQCVKTKDPKKMDVKSKLIPGFASPADDTLKALDAAIHQMLLQDGDRDHSNRSDLRVGESMAICDLLKRLRHQLYPDEPR
jgi:hypothetical protein